MSIVAARLSAYADLGDAWLCDQTARLRQRHLQFGWHFRLDLDALLERAARTARAARSVKVSAARESASNDHLWHATIEAIGYCARLEARLDARTEHTIAL